MNRNNFVKLEKKQGREARTNHSAPCLPARLPNVLCVKFATMLYHQLLICQLTFHYKQLKVCDQDVILFDSFENGIPTASSFVGARKWNKLEIILVTKTKEVHLKS